MAEQFFATRETGGRGPTEPLTLLSGPSSCGKTSLLFQYALNCASESSSNKVVIICNKRRLENKPPFLSQGVDSSCDVFQRIQMKYIDDVDGLKKYFAAFHLHESFPSAVIIDDFGDFFGGRSYQDRYGNARGRDLSMVRTLALCRDAISHANKKSQTMGSCKLLMSDTHQGDSPRFLFIYKRWIQCIFTIQGNGSGSFFLKNISTSGNIGGKMRTAKYSVALQYLVLEEMVDE